jgi:hypothetical protein
MNLLESLKHWTTVVADTGDRSSIKFALYAPVAPARRLLGGQVEAPRGEES